MVLNTDCLKRHLQYKIHTHTHTHTQYIYIVILTYILLLIIYHAIVHTRDSLNDYKLTYGCFASAIKHLQGQWDYVNEQS